MLLGLVGVKWINWKAGTGSLVSLIMTYFETQSVYIRNREWWKTSQRNKEWSPQRWINHNCLVTEIWRWMSNHLGARNSFAFHPTKRTKQVTIQTCSACVQHWPSGTWSCQPGTNNSCFSLCAVSKAVMQYFLFCSCLPGMWAIPSSITTLYTLALVSYLIVYVLKKEKYIEDSIISIVWSNQLRYWNIFSTDKRQLFIRTKKYYSASKEHIKPWQAMERLKRKLLNAPSHCVLRFAFTRISHFEMCFPLSTVVSLKLL